MGGHMDSAIQCHTQKQGRIYYGPQPRKNFYLWTWTSLTEMRRIPFFFISRHILSKNILNYYCILNFINKNFMDICFLSCWISNLYNIFVSWSLKPKLYTIWPFTENVCPRCSDIDSRWNWNLAAWFSSTWEWGHCLPYSPAPSWIVGNRYRLCLM